MLSEMWEETGEKPPALSNRPELDKHWRIPYQVWLELSGSRNYTMGGAAEIPFSEFFLWAHAHGYSKLEMQSMWEDVHTVDRVWLHETQKKAEAEKPAAKNH